MFNGLPTDPMVLVLSILAVMVGTGYKIVVWYTKRNGTPGGELSTRTWTRREADRVREDDEFHRVKDVVGQLEFRAAKTEKHVAILQSEGREMGKKQQELELEFANLRGDVRVIKADMRATREKVDHISEDLAVRLDAQKEVLGGQVSAIQESIQALTEAIYTRPRGPKTPEPRRS